MPLKALGNFWAMIILEGILRPLSLNFYAHLPERALPIAHNPFLGKRPESFLVPSFMVLA